MKTTLYAATTTEKTNPPKIFTITGRRRDCEEYIDRKLMCEHYAHFSSWCSLHGKAPDLGGWKAYIGAGVLSEAELGKYSILKLRYGPDDLAYVLRIMNGCMPLGCKYEKENEYEHFLNSLPDELHKEIEKRLKEEDESDVQQKG